jgi:signal transduction histidine kinase
MMLLGDKQDRSLYTQEEIEIAQASGERIVDMLTGEEMARRLLALQRQRLVETQVMDRRTRRALHDELLPGLHTAILRLSSLAQNEAAQEAITVLSEAHRQIADLIRTPPGARLLSVEQVGLSEALKHAIQSEFVAEFDEIEWHVEGEPPRLDPLSTEVLYHATREMTRNAALHGRGNNRDLRLCLRITISTHECLVIRIADNGIGPRTH